MRLGIQTLRLPGDAMAEKFAAAARAGFDGVEVSVGPFFDQADGLEEVKAASAASGVPVCAICTHSMHDPLVPDAEERARRLAGLAELLRMADELGAAGVISVPVRPPHAFPDMTDLPRELMAWAGDELERWAGDLPEGTAAVFLEPLNRYEAFFLRRVEQAAELAERVGSPRVMALADLFHMQIEELDQAAAIRSGGARLGHVHIADNTRLQPGVGGLDFRTPFAALKEVGYDGWLSIECSALGGPDAADGLEALLAATARFTRDQWEIA